MSFPRRLSGALGGSRHSLCGQRCCRCTQARKSMKMAPSAKKHAEQSWVIPGGFTVLPLKYSSDSVSQHSLYVKEHRVRAEKTTSRPLDRTLFVLNIPPYCSEEIIKDLFSTFGKVQSVELREKPGTTESSDLKLSKYFRPALTKGFSVGYVVFTSPSGVKAAKSHPRDIPLIVSTENHPVKVGIQKWIQQYRQSLINPEKLQAAVDTFMQGYDQKKEEESERQKEAEEDDEGWVKVTRGVRGSKARPHSEMANQRALQKEDKKRKRKELLNFYTWQHRQTQREREFCKA
uniref:Ribosomal RNA processing 7 homolog A n=1 Tax=Scleropages formosus TaxID=113540 RepID=A0A8C9RSV3_SCLFO